jgi:hypothetical protein
VTPKRSGFAAPDETLADRASDLEFVSTNEDIVEQGGDFAFVESFHGELELCRSVGGGRDRVERDAVYPSGAVKRMT